MQIKMILSSFRNLILILILCLQTAFAGRFDPLPGCTNGQKVCVESGERIVEGIKVSKPCWRYSYIKTCPVNSLDNCKDPELSKCYELKQKGCKQYDRYRNCVNQIHEFSCKVWNPVEVQKESVRYDVVERDGEKGLICEGIPCVDGNCIDKSYEMNGDMMDSVSKLYALAQGKNKDGEFNIFEGLNLHCNIKPLEFLGCCHVYNGKGWGKVFGARCSNNEKLLSKKRGENLCVKVGTKKTGTVVKITKHYFCCFANMIDKVLQVQGRAQLGKNFGTADNPDCRGFTIEELEKIDFEKLDFSEVEAELQKKMVMSDMGDLKSRIKDSMPEMGEFDMEDLENPANQRSGINMEAGKKKE